MGLKVQVKDILCPHCGDKRKTIVALVMGLVVLVECKGCKKLYTPKEGRAEEYHGPPQKTEGVS